MIALFSILSKKFIPRENNKIYFRIKHHMGALSTQKLLNVWGSCVFK